MKNDELMIKHKRYTELTRQSLKLAWASFRNNLGRLSEHESHALHGHVDDARARAMIATQAGDISTLFSDQLELLPQSRKRIHDNRNIAQAIACDTLTDWAHITEAYWQALKKLD